MPEKSKSYRSVFSPVGGFDAFPNAGKPVYIPMEGTPMRGYDGRIPVSRILTNPFDKAVDIVKENIGLGKKQAGPEEIRQPEQRLELAYDRPNFDSPEIKREHARRMNFYNGLRNMGVPEPQFMSDGFFNRKYSIDTKGVTQDGRIMLRDSLNEDPDLVAAVHAHEAAHYLGEHSEEGAYRLGSRLLEQSGQYRALDLLRELEANDKRV